VFLHFGPPKQRGPLTGGSPPFGTAGNVRRFRDMAIEFYFTPELHLKDGRIISYISRMGASSGISKTRRALLASRSFARESTSETKSCTK
jgi:hypothetical protein